MPLPTQRWVSYMCKIKVASSLNKSCYPCVQSLTTNWSVRKLYFWIIFLFTCISWWLLQHLNIVDTSTTLSTQRWINRIATSYSKMVVSLVSMKIALLSNKAVSLVLYISVSRNFYIIFFYHWYLIPYSVPWLRFLIQDSSF